MAPFYDTPPPAIDPDDEYSQMHDARTRHFRRGPPVDRMPQGRGRANAPYWYDAVVPDLETHGTVMIGAHGSSLRALVKHLDGISDADIAGLNIPTGIPLVYELDAQMRPTGPGQYLDPAAAESAAAAVPPRQVLRTTLEVVGLPEEPS